MPRQAGLRAASGEEVHHEDAAASLADRPSMEKPSIEQPQLGFSTASLIVRIWTNIDIGLPTTSHNFARSPPK